MKSKEAWAGAEEESGWDRHCLERERTQARVYALLSTLLIAAWAPIDLLEPANLAELWGLRVCDVVAGLFVLHRLRSATSVSTVRALAALKFASTGIAVALMIPLVREHYWPYVIGFSLPFWGAAVVYSIPLRTAAVAAASVLLAAALAHALYGEDRSAGELVGAGFFIFSTAVIALAQIGVRRRLEWRAFLSAHRLEVANRKIAETEQLKSQFFANVSHELRTPLTLILGPVEQLLAADGLTEAQRRDLEVIARNGRTLLRHVNDLLDIAVLESGKLEPEYVRTDLAETVRTLAAHFDGMAAQRSLAYRVETPRALPVEIDAGKVQRVLQNLLSNAFKFTPPGGTVRVELRAEKERAILEVADSGPGIPPEKREVAFDRFRQGDGGSTREFGGTGLGLSIARDFVELHRGSIEIDDAPEGGALLRIALPLRAPEGAEVAGLQEERAAALWGEPRPWAAEFSERAEADALARDGTEPLVLVVEDNLDMNRFLRAALAGGYRTEAAFSGRAGLARALELRPDLILTDVMMPEMSGDELLREARKRPELDDVPIVVLTARADQELRVRLLEQGAQDYVTKPFVVKELLARVGNLVSVRRARRVLQQELQAQTRDVEELARELAHRKRALATALESMRVAREQAERSSQAKTSFLGMVSHELRTPLAALELQLERLGLEVSERGRPDSSRKSTLVRRIKASSGRLHELIENVLQYTRLESGTLSLRIETFDAGEVVAEAADEARPMAEDKGLTLSCDIARELPPLCSDRRLVHLVVVNLLGNAAKFTERGAITVSVCYQDGQHLFRVEDSGPGISPEDLSRVFDPFEQGAPLRKKHKPGAGLGLALVRQMTSSLRGSVAVDSVVGRGSTFAVSLPSLDAPAPEALAGDEATPD